MKNNTQSTLKTQLDKANAALVKLKKDITSDDRKAASLELDIKARSTMVQYLNGKGKDLDVSVKLLGFLRKRIVERENVIAA
jgi:hypothetical protein